MLCSKINIVRLNLELYNHRADGFLAKPIYWHINFCQKSTLLHQKMKVQQESLKAYMAAELNFWYKTPAIIFSFREEKTLSLSKFCSTGSPCHSLTPVIVSSLRRRKLSLSNFFKMQGSWGLWTIIVWPEYIVISYSVCIPIKIIQEQCLIFSLSLIKHCLRWNSSGKSVRLLSEEEGSC